MKPIRPLLALSLGLALVAPLALLARNDAATMLSGPTADQATTSRLVYGLLSDSRYAYRPRALNDALSQDILKRYLEALDPGKVFFTAQDISGFDKYKALLDDAIKSGDVAPAWAIFAVYRQRMTDRITQARGLLKGNFDFTGNEQYQFDPQDAGQALRHRARQCVRAQGRRRLPEFHECLCQRD